MTGVNQPVKKHTFSRQGEKMAKVPTLVCPKIACTHACIQFSKNIYRKYICNIRKKLEMYKVKECIHMSLYIQQQIHIAGYQDLHIMLVIISANYHSYILW